MPSRPVKELGTTGHSLANLYFRHHLLAFGASFDTVGWATGKAAGL